jgi:hypothetical protein
MADKNKAEGEMLAHENKMMQEAKEKFKLREQVKSFFKERKVFRIEDNQFNALVEKIYGRSYEVNAEEEHLYEASLEFTPDANYYDSEEADAFENGGDAPRAGAILNNLLKRKLIEPGHYIIYYGG